MREAAAAEILFNFLLLLQDVNVMSESVFCGTLQLRK